MPVTNQSKRRATRGAEQRTDNAPSSALIEAEESAHIAEENAKFWVEMEATMTASLGRQEQLACWLQKELNHMPMESNPSDTLLITLDKTRKALWEAKWSNR
ncbi:hypothetical protein, conserved [Eimeria necatrix]|uniref:Uncharacterized protein n=1 Tax=Eimeria necatrix TaxID=51315 RepID=U6MDP4_9EIME|nr:hypothetical protein, conserved [Eimeria necatrix]CDJ62126.1 hypothetical protein, conserved [Eimeria necatrix]